MMNNTASKNRTLQLLLVFNLSVSTALSILGTRQCICTLKLQTIKHVFCFRQLLTKTKFTVLHVVFNVC